MGQNIAVVGDIVFSFQQNAPRTSLFGERVSFGMFRIWTKD